MKQLADPRETSMSCHSQQQSDEESAVPAQVSDAMAACWDANFQALRLNHEVHEGTEGNTPVTKDHHQGGYAKAGKAL